MDKIIITGTNADVKTLHLLKAVLDDLFKMDSLIDVNDDGTHIRYGK